MARLGIGFGGIYQRTFALAASQYEQQHQRTSRRLKAVTVTEIIAATASTTVPDPSSLLAARSKAAVESKRRCCVGGGQGNRCRPCRRHSDWFHPDSSSNFACRATKRSAESQTYRYTVATFRVNLVSNRKPSATPSVAADLRGQRRCRLSRSSLETPLWLSSNHLLRLVQ